MRNDAPLRITVVEPLGTGGMIHYAYQLSTALSEAGASVTLLTSSDYELDVLPHGFRVERRLRLWPHHDDARSEAVGRSSSRRAVAVAARSGRRLLRGVRLVRAWIAITRSLSAGESDVVQFGALRFPFEGIFLRLLSRRGFLLADVCHEPELREATGVARRLAAMASRGTYASFDAVFVHGRYNRERFTGLYPDLAGRTFSIAHGNEHVLQLLSGDGGEHTAALRRRYALTGDEPVVLFFGHLVPSKGVDDLVRAHALSSARTGAKLVIAGYPSKLFDVRGLRSLVRELGVEESVVLDLRYVPGEEVGALLTLATVVVLPYRSATQSGVLQAAYTFGRPVVATRVGALPEAVDEGVSGLLVPVESPQALAEAVEAIVASPEVAARMGAHARQLSETRFSWDLVADDVLRVYERLLATRAR